LRRMTLVKLTLVAAAWGASFVAGKHAVEQLPPMTVAFFRFLLSSTYFLPFLLKAPRPSRRDWLPIAFLGLTGIFLYNVFFLFGVALNPAGETALVIASNPLAITTLSVIFLKERVSAAQVAGVLIGFLGVIVVLTNGTFNLHIAPSQLILLGGVISFAAYSVAGKPVVRRIGATRSAAYSCVAGTLMLAPFGIYAAAGVNLSKVTWLGWFSIAYLGILCSAVAYVWWYDGIAEVGAARTGVFVNLVPVFASLFSWVLLGERMKQAHVLGAAMVILGVTLALGRRSERAGAKASCSLRS